MSAVPLAGLTFIVYRQLVAAPVERSKSRWFRSPCAVEGGAFQWVKVPPGERSSGKQPEQAWRRRNV